ncbi:unnamed protein product [Orchesella dallaii]|uniref:Uncharacterized protein n=1 Tax=Orchesella dallaii TaxID=48710 RepID=A0ABP1R116_9HEXA
MFLSTLEVFLRISYFLSLTFALKDKAQPLRQFLSLSNPRSIFLSSDSKTEIQNYFDKYHILSCPVCINVTAIRRGEIKKESAGYDIILTWKRNEQAKTLISYVFFKYVIVFSNKQLILPDYSFFMTVPSIFLIQNFDVGTLNIVCIICQTIIELPRVSDLQDIDRIWFDINLDFGGDAKVNYVYHGNIFTYTYRVRYKVCSGRSILRKKSNFPLGTRIFCVMSIFREMFNMSEIGYHIQEHHYDEMRRNVKYPLPDLEIDGDINFQIYNKSHSIEQNSTWWYVADGLDDGEALEYMIMMTRTEYFNFQALVQPLHLHSWLLVLVSAAIMVIFLKVQRTSGSELWTFAQILEQDSGLRVNLISKIGKNITFTISMAIVSWLLFTFLLRNEYTSNLTSYLMAGPKLSIPSFTELHRQNIPVLNTFRNEHAPDFFKNPLLLFPQVSGHEPLAYADFIETLTGSQFELSLSHRLRRVKKFRTFISKDDLHSILRLFHSVELPGLEEHFGQFSLWQFLDSRFPEISAFVNTRDNLEIIGTALKYLTQGNRNFYIGHGRVIKQTLQTQNIWYFSRKFYAPYMARYLSFLITSGIYNFWSTDDKLVRKSIRFHEFTKSLDGVASKFRNRFGVESDSVRSPLDSLLYKLLETSSFFNQYLLGNSEIFSNPNGEVSNSWEPISFGALIIVGTISFALLAFALIVLLIEIRMTKTSLN